MRPRCPRSGISLIELLVVLAIVGALIGLTVPAIIQAREAASRSQCQNNLHQLGIAANAFQAAYGEMVPYATGVMDEPYASWLVYLLPHLDQESVYREIMRNNGATSDGHGKIITNGAVPGINLRVLACGSDPTAGRLSYFAKTSYQANWYVYGDEQKPTYFPARRNAADLADGTSNVVLFGEAYSECGTLVREAFDIVDIHTFGITLDVKPSDHPSYAPDDYTMFQHRPGADDKRPGGCHQWRIQTGHNSMNVCMADGSVRTVATNVDPALWKGALKPRDGVNLTDE